MDVRFWGVRGSIPVSGTRYQAAGGHTTCVELVHAGHRLVIDGGTGLRALGASLGFRAVEATFVFTHVHWDHIQGVPFFGPAFHPDSRFVFGGAEGLKEALEAQMCAPQFPITLDALQARIEWRALRSERSFRSGPFEVTPLALSHPGEVFAYRVEAGDRAVVFATDVEHAGVIDEALVELAAGVDLLIHDAQYTEAEYASRRGWGHSTVDEAVEVARLAEVGALALFHHDPDRDDDALCALEAHAQARLPHAFAAREGPALAL